LSLVESQAILPSVVEDVVERVRDGVVKIVPVGSVGVPVNVGLASFA
jgi:hypothetical protein